MKSLQHLDIGSNHLQGELVFLDALSNCRDLHFINLQVNDFTGGLPDYTGNLSKKLVVFDATGNKLTGGIPSTISNLSAVSSLILMDNQLSQSIPESTMTMENLERIDISGNSFVGPIPAQIGISRDWYNCFSTTINSLVLYQMALVISLCWSTFPCLITIYPHMCQQACFFLTTLLN